MVELDVIFLFFFAIHMRLLAYRESFLYIFFNHPEPSSKGNWKAPKVREGFEDFFLVAWRLLVYS